METRCTGGLSPGEQRRKGHIVLSIRRGRQGRHSGGWYRYRELADGGIRARPVPVGGIHSPEVRRVVGKGGYLMVRCGQSREIIQHGVEQGIRRDLEPVRVRAKRRPPLERHCRGLVECSLCRRR